MSEERWTSDKRKRMGALMSELWTGVPKSDEQRRKMSEAKVGKEKSKEHKRSMSDAHIERHKRIKKIREEHDCSFKEALKILKELNKSRE